MINRYIVFEQYEYWANNGKQFSNWFRAPLSHFHKTKESAEKELSNIKNSSSNTDKVSKLKHKYEIRKVDIETLPIPKIRYGKTGRPSKKEKERLEYEQKNYWKIHENEYTV